MTRFGGSLNALAHMAAPPRVPPWTGSSRLIVLRDTPIKPIRACSSGYGGVQLRLLGVLRKSSKDMTTEELCMGTEFAQVVCKAMARLVDKGLAIRVKRGVYRARWPLDSVVAPRNAGAA